MDTATVSAPPQAPPAAVGKSKGRTTLGFFTYRQGAAVPFAVFLAVFMFFFNPRANSVVEAALWYFIPPLIIYVWHLAITQLLPVVRAPLFESHFTTLKDLGVSIWPPIAVGAAMLLALVLGRIQMFWFEVDVDITLIEASIAAHVAIATALDIMVGSGFTLMKNQLSSEAALGRMTGAAPS